MIKYSFLSTLFLFGLIFMANGGAWVPQNLPPGDWALSSIHFVDSSKGVAVGPLNAVLVTSDGGTNWVIPKLPNFSTDYMFWDVFIRNDGFGIVVGTLGSVLRTFDYGQKWEQVSFPTTDESLSSVWIIGNTVWTGSNKGKIYYSTNLGSSWELHQQILPTSINSSINFTFISDSVGFIANGNALFKTTNGGTTWEKIGNSQNITKVFFIDDLNGWAIGDQGYFAKTSDQGITWETVDFPTKDYLTSLFCVDNLHGWITTFNSKIYSTSDGGSTWNLEYENSKPYYYLTDIFFANPRKGWAVGSGDRNNAILTYTSVSSIGEEPQRISPFFPVVNNSLFINLGKSNYVLSELKVFDLFGNQVCYRNFSNDGNTDIVINLNYLPNGIYFAKLLMHINQKTIWGFEKIIISK